MILFLFVLAGCSSTLEWDLQPRALDHVPPPGAQQLELTGPQAVFARTAQQWTVTGDNLQVGDRVEIGWGGELGPGRCPYRQLVGGHLCLDITNPARPMARTTAVAHPTIPGAAMAVFNVVVPGTTRDVIHLQALQVAGPDSATSNTLAVDRLRGPACDPLGSPFGGGAGSASDPYTICHPDHVGSLHNLSNVHAVQVQDLDWTGHTVGGLILGFDSVYDGGGYRIDHYTGTQALFRVGRPRAVVRRVRMFDASVTAAGRAALLVEQAFEDTLMEDIHLQGTVVSTNVGQSGGLAASAIDSLMVDVVVDVVVDEQNGDDAGAVAGLMSGGSATNIEARGTVTNTLAGRFTVAGGVFGTFGSGVLEGCTASTEVFSSDGHAGGIVGNLSTGTIRGCVFTGTAHGNRTVGGIVGFTNKGLIERCAAFGDVSGTASNSAASIGGVLGLGYASSDPALLLDVVAAPSVVATGTPPDCSAGGLAGDFFTFPGAAAIAEAHRLVVAPIEVPSIDGRDLFGGQCSGSSSLAVSGVYAVETIVGGELVPFVDVSSAPDAASSYPDLDFVDVWTIPVVNPHIDDLLPVPQSLCGRAGIVCAL